MTREFDVAPTKRDTTETTQAEAAGDAIEVQPEPTELDAIRAEVEAEEKAIAELRAQALDLEQQQRDEQVVVAEKQRLATLRHERSILEAEVAGKAQQVEATRELNAKVDEKIEAQATGTDTPQGDAEQVKADAVATGSTDPATEVPATEAQGTTETTTTETDTAPGFRFGR